MGLPWRPPAPTLGLEMGGGRRASRWLVLSITPRPHWLGTCRGTWGWKACTQHPRASLGWGLSSSVAWAQRLQ